MIIEVFHKKLAEMAPKCYGWNVKDHCAKYATHHCEYYDFTKSFGNGFCRYNYCIHCGPPKILHTDYCGFRIWENKDFKEVVPALLEYERGCF